MGYGPMTFRSISADINGMTEAAYRTEVLCQWVTADITSTGSLRFSAFSHKKSPMILHRRFFESSVLID